MAKLLVYNEYDNDNDNEITYRILWSKNVKVEFPKLMKILFEEQW
jgi:hypothetical protein